MRHVGVVLLSVPEWHVLQRFQSQHLEFLRSEISNVRLLSVLT